MKLYKRNETKRVDSKMRKCDSMNEKNDVVDGGDGDDDENETET